MIENYKSYYSDEDTFNQRVDLTSKNNNYFNTFLKYRGSINSNTDLNNYYITGIYWINEVIGAIVHAPGGTGYLIVIQIITTHCLQMFIEFRGLQMKIRGTDRYNNASNWTEWKSF